MSEWSFASDRSFPSNRRERRPAYRLRPALQEGRSPGQAGQESISRRARLRFCRQPASFERAKAIERRWQAGGDERPLAPEAGPWQPWGARIGGSAAMIRKFVTVYPGHIDLPDMGQEATPANARRYSNDELASVFEKTEAVAKTMDRLGYDTLWLAEHHFQHEGYECLPNILMVAVHLAHVTKRLKI